MAMIGGERAELAACSGNRVPPALQHRIDGVFSALFASRRLPASAADADDRMRVSPPQRERTAITATGGPTPRWGDAEPGEVPAVLAG
ncbi:MAG TPA: hypothetical protein VEY93_06835 [Longimicrobium sp.]|nr:hypothetical protein [Longimicrobium sp.]